MDVGDVLADRYELLDQIGVGGMGRVLRARDRTLDRIVAVKLLAPHLLGDEDAVAALREEAQQAASVRHPNVVQVLDAVLHDTDQPAIVMEYVDGPSLAEVIPADGMDVDTATEVLRAVGHGLAAVHAAGLVHRDVAPRNVLLDNGVPRLTDFGIARSADAGATTTIRGSLPYLAPEQAEEAPIGPAADIYALGCLATKVLTGAPPFSASHPLAVVHKHLNEAAPDVRDHAPDVPPEMAAGIAAALQKDPADRPGSVLELLEQMGLAGASSVPGATPQAGPDRLGATTVLAGGVAASGEAVAGDRETTRVMGRDAAVAATAENDAEDSRRRLALLLLAALAILLLAWLALAGVGDDPDTSPSELPSPTAPSSASPSPSPSPTATPSPSPSPPAQAEPEPEPEPPPADGDPGGRGPEGEGPPGQQDDGPGGGPDKKP